MGADGSGKISKTAECWFFDTNVRVNLFDEKAPTKQRLAQDLFRKAVDEAQSAISTQVLIAVCLEGI